MDTKQKAVLRNSSYVPMDDYQHMPRGDERQEKDWDRFGGKTWYTQHAERRVHPVFQGRVRRQRELQSGKKSSLLLVFHAEKPASWELCRWSAHTTGDSFVVSKTQGGVWYARRVDRQGKIAVCHGRKIHAWGNNPANALARCCGIVQAYHPHLCAWLSLHDYYRRLHFDFDHVMRARRLLYPKDVTHVLPPVHAEKPRPTPMPAIHADRLPTVIPPAYQTNGSYGDYLARVPLPGYNEKRRKHTPNPLAWRRTYDTWLPQHYKASRSDWWLESLEKTVT